MNTFQKSMMMLSVCTLPLFSCTAPAPQAEEAIISSEVYKALPFEMPQVVQPTFPNLSLSIVDFGAKGDGGHPRAARDRARHHRRTAVFSK